MDVQLYLSLLRYCCSCRASFGKLPKILVPARGAHHSIVWWLQLQNLPSGIPHQYQTHRRCFTTVICCGCVYISVLTTLQLFLPGKNLEVGIVQWLRLQTQSSGLPHQYQTYITCFTIFLCCGCVYVSVLTTLLMVMPSKCLLLLGIMVTSQNGHATV